MRRDRGRRRPARSIAVGVVIAALTALTMGPGPALAADQAASAGITSSSDRVRRVSGPTIQLDPGFAYYQGRSRESIADEIVQNGYVAVRYFVVNENNVDAELVDALQARGLTVWALVLGNGSYSVERFPEGWQDWQMQLVTPVNDGYYRFSPHSPEYVAWKKQAVAKLVHDYGFDGIEVAEPYFPDWNGISRGYYGDVGPHAQRAFKAEYGREIPNFTDPSASNYYLNDRELYDKWVEFRVDAVNRFLNELINGTGGVRDVNPGVLVATWSLAVDAGPDSVALEREYQGLDAAEMISTVKPDLHVLQTNWPDWIRPDLPGDYVLTYQNFVDDIRKDHPRIPLGVQTDIGSQPAMARDRNWLNSFVKTATEMGFSTWTAYEYHIGGYMYQEPPVPTTAARLPDGGVTVSFQKRIDAESAKAPESFAVYIGDNRRLWVKRDSVSVDGNRVVIDGEGLPRGAFKLQVRNVTDDPDTWLYHKDASPNVVPAGASIMVPPVRGGS